MSNNSQNSKIIILVSTFVLLCLLLSAAIYIFLSDDKSSASKEVFAHFENLSTLVVGYFLGNSRDKSKKTNKKVNKD